MLVSVHNSQKQLRAYLLETGSGMQLVSVIPAMQNSAHTDTYAWLHFTVADSFVRPVAQQLRDILNLSISQPHSLLPALTCAATELIIYYHYSLLSTGLS